MRNEQRKLNLKGRYHLGDLGVDGGYYQHFYKETRCKGVDWIYLVQYKTQWRVLLKNIMNFLVA
jgi:hypothetical protein